MSESDRLGLFFIFHNFFFFFKTEDLDEGTNSMRVETWSLDRDNSLFFKIFSYLCAPGLSCSMGDHLAAACGISFPDQGSNLGPLHWELGASSLSH